MREILLHGRRPDDGDGGDDTFDRSVTFARRLAESFAARLHIVYTVEDASGWTEEIRPEQLPIVHEAIEQEARERLQRIIGEEDQIRLGVEIALRTGPTARELAAYTEERNIDLAVLQVPLGDGRSADLARSLIEHGRCAVLVLR